LALNSLNITVLDGVNVQQISVILDDMWTSLILIFYFALFIL